MQTTNTRPLYAIAGDIHREASAEFQKRGVWPSWYQYASHYLEAMGDLSDINENYYADSGKSIVLYALSNLQNWRGDTARAIKAELKAIAGIK
jgi:hypothetical protein